MRKKYPGEYFFFSAATSPGLGVHPYLLMITGTIAVSLAFMLSVATPPNAVIFSSGYLKLPQMTKTGFGMNILGMPLPQSSYIY